MRIDINADLGEGAGFDAELLELVSSANIATGFHAGEPKSVAFAIREAQQRGVAVGAHPSFADRENFGRREMVLPPGEIFAVVTYQLGAFRALAEAMGARMNHVKPHGALYNMAARDAEIAEAIVHAMLAVDAAAVLFALSGSALEAAGRAGGIAVAREVFADRNYMPDGSLVPRDRADALLHDPAEAAERVVEILRSGKVTTIDGSRVAVAAETVCVHGDTPGAVEFVRQLRASLARAGVTVQPFRSS
ncbi:MAG: LamB/YcsF family protein [Chthoniobacterales bacterium]|nr:LamB/YcsF family protein [Chthoniobacterales bacterium]